LEILPFISEINTSISNLQLLNLLNKITSLALKNAEFYSKSGYHNKAAEQYLIIAEAYSKALDLINSSPKFSSLEYLKEILTIGTSYWKKRANYYK
jgi:hypothetical protein